MAIGDDLVPTLATDPGTYGTTSDIQRRRLLAQQLMTSGSSTAPVQHWSQGVARMLQGAMGGYDSYVLDRDQKAGEATDATNLGKMLAGMSGGQTVATPTGAALGKALADNSGSSLPTFAGGGSGVSMPRGLRNNNPGNIEDGSFAQSQPGYAGTDGRFARFASLDNGVGAQSALLNSYGNRGINTIAGVVNRWAPSAENGAATSNYVTAVAKDMGVAPDAPLNMTDPTVRRNLALAMGKFENGRPVQVASLDPSAGVSAYASQAGAGAGNAAIDGAMPPMPVPRPAGIGDPNSGGSVAHPGALSASRAAASDVSTGPGYEGSGVAGATSGDDDATPAPTRTSATALPPVTATAPTTPATPRPMLNGRVSPDVLQSAIASMRNPYASPASKSVATAIISAAFAKQDPISVAKGTVLLDPVTRQPIFSNKDDDKSEQTNDIKNYNFYTQQAKAAGQPVMSFDVWSTQKARAAAMNTTVNVPIDNGKAQNAGQVEAYKLDAEAVRKAQNEIVPALDSADENMAIMRAAIDRNGGKLPTGGVLAEMGLNFGRLQSYLRDSYGINVGSVDELANLESFNKGGFRLGGDMAKAIGGNRVLKTEFEQSLRAVPGLETGNAGNVYNLDVMQNANNNKRAYHQAQEDYYRSNKGSLDGFNKSWKHEIESNPRILSNFSVVRPIDAGDGSQFVKLPSTGKGGYTWYRKGQDDPQPIMDPSVVKRLEAQAPMPSQGGKSETPRAPGVKGPEEAGKQTRGGVTWSVE